MPIDDVSKISYKIQEIKANGDTSSVKGRKAILDEISGLGKELLDALNVKDKTLVEIEGDYNDILKELEDYEKGIETAQNEAETAVNDMEGINAQIAEFEERIANGEELSEDEKSVLQYYYQLRESGQSDIENANNDLNDLSGNMDSASSKITQYKEVLTDIVSNMDDYAQAGNDIKQAAGDVGRSKMAENLDTKSYNALTRHEYNPRLTGDTQKVAQRAGLTGMGDGVDGINMTYHDDKLGGYKAEYDLVQTKFTGKLRDATAKTWSYGKTVNTAANDMKNRAANYETSAAEAGKSAEAVEPEETDSK